MSFLNRIIAFPPISVIRRNAAPFSWIHIRDGLRERPAMTANVLHSALPLPKRIILWGIDKVCPGLFGALIIVVDVIYMEENKKSTWFLTLNGNYGVLAEGKLDAVIPNPQSFFE